MNEKLKEFFTGLGVLAEVTKASYDAFVKAGFDAGQSLCLASEFMKASLQIAMENGQKEDE